MKRIPQPAMIPASRNPETREFWPGFVITLIGVALVVCGARHLTGVPTADGGTATETQLVRAYAFGGLQYSSKLPPPPPPNLSDPAAQAEALDRWARQQETAQAPTWKVRVDLAAKTPCPT